MTGDFFVALLKLLVAFPLVLVIIYFFFKFLNQKQQLFHMGKYIKIIEQIPVAPKAYLAVAKLGQKFVVISITEKSINILQEVPEEDTAFLTTNLSQEFALPTWVENVTGKVPKIRFSEVLRQKKMGEFGEGERDVHDKDN